MADDRIKVDGKTKFKYSVEVLDDLHLVLAATEQAVGRHVAEMRILNLDLHKSRDELRTRAQEADRRVETQKETIRQLETDVLVLRASTTWGAVARNERDVAIKQMQELKDKLDEARVNLDLERDLMRAELDKIVKERDEACSERDRFRSELLARSESCGKEIAELRRRNASLAETNRQLHADSTERDDALAHVSSLEKALEITRRQRDEQVQKRRDLARAIEELSRKSFEVES